MSVDQLIATPDFVALADAIAVNAERLPDSLLIAFGVHEFAAEDFVCVIYEHAEVSCHYATYHSLSSAWPMSTWSPTSPGAECAWACLSAFAPCSHPTSAQSPACVGVGAVCTGGGAGVVVDAGGGAAIRGVLSLLTAAIQSKSATNIATKIAG
jgi:hypothetical protein